MSVAEIESMPCERDWALFQMVRVEQWPTPAVAEGCGLSQTRVRQIVQKLTEHVLQKVTVPSKADEARQLAAGKLLAADRIEHLFSLAMSAFRASKSAKNCGKGRRSFGDMRYLIAASRFTLMAATLPPPRHAWPEILEEEEPEAETQSEQEWPEDADINAEDPCSAPAAEEVVAPVAETSAADATAAAMLGCIEKSRDNSAPKTNVPRPVQKGRSNAAKESRRAKFFQTS